MTPKLLISFVALALGIASAQAGFPDNSPAFKTDYPSALAAAKKSGKPLLVVFSASWCGPCQANKRDVYPSEQIQPFHDQFVWVYLDTDVKSNSAVAKSFGVSGIPHIQFVSAKGEAIDKQVGGTNPRNFARKLRSVLRSAS